MGKYVLANWKMNKTATESVEFVKELLRNIDKKDRFILFPSFVALSETSKALNGSGAVGAQNIYCEEQGAFTGEISPKMILETGAKYVLVGHSERRHIFGETDEMICKKVAIALKHNLNVVLCVGETKEEHNVIKQILTQQLKGLNGLDISKVIVAYEPVWAIGTGIVPSVKDIETAHMFIKTYMLKHYDINVQVLYGGSVSPSNAKEIFASELVDGVLVGGASNDVAKFADLIKMAR